MSLQITGHVVPGRPSRSGESFSIRRDDELVAVVDVGSPCPCPAVRVTAGAIPVLVLTHSDTDHVGAAACLLSNKRVEEVWLPLDWYLLVRALPQREQDRVRRAEVWVERSRTEAVEEIRQVRAEIARMPVLVGGERVVEGSDDVALPAPDELESLPVDSVVRDLLAGGAPQRVLEVVSPLEAAGRAGGPRVRVFSVDAATWLPQRGGESPWQASGIRGSLTVVNAWETVLPTAVSTSLSAEAFCLYLTWQNRRALALMAREDTSLGSAKALLTSDCGGADLPEALDIPWCEVGAVAGLHHGSDNAAHDTIYSRCPDAVLLRTESSSVKRLHRDWRAKPRDKRACTACKSSCAVDTIDDALIESTGSGFRILAQSCAGR